MTIKIVAGDITTFSGDAIVNPANNAGLGGGGLDGIIHIAAGPKLLEACQQLPIWDAQDHAREMPPKDTIRIPNGAAIPTPSFDIPAKWIIHVAGPVWPDRSEGIARLGQASKHLHECYRNALALASAMKLKSIAVPSISGGIYGCPLYVTARIGLSIATEFPDLETTFFCFPGWNLTLYQSVATDLCIQVAT